jgi:hypothetical protein
MQYDLVKTFSMGRVVYAGQLLGGQRAVEAARVAEAAR